MRFVAVAILAWAGLTKVAVAADELRMESTVDRAPVSIRQVLSLDETSLKVLWAAGEQGREAERSVRREDLISLVFPAISTSRTRRGTDLLHLTSGDRLRVLSVVCGEETLSASLAANPATRLTIPLEQIRGLIRLEKPAQQVDWTTRLPMADGASDVVLLQNADRIRGEFLGLSEESLSINTDGGETTIAREDLRGIAFSLELLSLRPIPQRHAIVQFRDGSYLTVDAIRRAAGETDWEIRVADTLWTIPEESLARVAFYSESAKSLLSEPPTDRRTIPFLPEVSDVKTIEATGSTTPLTPAAAAGTAPFPPPPVLSGRPIPRGFEAGGRTEWTYHLEPGWSEFRAAANVPDSAGERGSCVVRIEVDGQKVYESPLLRRASESVLIPPVPLEGASTLKLVVDYGEFWDVRNRGVWIDPRLIKVGAVPQGD